MQEGLTTSGVAPVSSHLCTTSRKSASARSTSSPTTMTTTTPAADSSRTRHPSRRHLAPLERCPPPKHTRSESQLIAQSFLYARQTRQVHPQQQVFSVEHHLMNLREKDATVVEIQTDSGHEQRHERRPAKTMSRRSQQQWDGRSMNSVSQIDRVSRVFFPILFVAINLFYWYTYVPPS